MRKYKPILIKEISMNSIADGSVILQTSSESVPSTPPWLDEVALLAQYLRKQGILSAIGERVRFARRLGHYDVIDLVAVLFRYAVSSERTLETFYKHLHPFADAFMALFGRDRFPARSTLSRFLAALTWEPLEVLRSLFLEDWGARQRGVEEQQCGLTDRMGNQWRVFDIDGRSPTDTSLSFGADRLLAFPVDGKLASINPLLRVGLPLDIDPSWTDDFNSVLLLAADQNGGRDVA